MPLLGRLIKRVLTLKSRLPQSRLAPMDYQQNELRYLLKSAQYTDFGKHYNFSSILNSQDPVQSFREGVPAFDYDRLYENWWHRLKTDMDVCWPGRIPYFAVSSGTSGAPSKYIPVSHEMVKAIRKAGVKQIYALAAYNLPPAMFRKGILILGGSTHLKQEGNYLVGDLSGISAGRIPGWFQHYYKPGPEIAAEVNWHKKLDEITRKATEWDIGIVCGIPSWVQIMMEKIIAHYNVNTIHDIWPNFSVYIHGGVNFGPYRKTFRQMMARPVSNIETYIASEGYIAFQHRPDAKMTMLLNNGIFYEFVPFNEQNFPNGNMVEYPEALAINEVEEGTRYALLLSTCAGTWRYLLGDVVQFTDASKQEIIITGRTKHFLNLCGEHLSVSNMSDAVQVLEDRFDIRVPEFTVAGVPHDGLFAHRWFIGCDSEVDAEALRDQLDDALKQLNDDYRIERDAALKDIQVEVVPVKSFYDWMEKRGKLGSQNKFPRVLQSSQLQDWKRFLQEETADWK